NLHTERSSLSKIVRSYGLSITSVAGYNDFTMDSEINKQVERLEWYCKLAADLQVGIVRVMSGEPRPDLTKEEMIRNIIHGFKNAVKMAKKYNVILALENHGYLVNDAPALVKIVEAVADDHLCLTLDTGNFCWAGHSLEKTHCYFKQVAPYVVNVHLKDLVFTNPTRVQFVPLGQGDLDLKLLIKELTAVGYNGALLCEYEGMGEPKELLQAGVLTREEFKQGIKDGTRQSLQYLKNLIHSN
ncbi:MAG TPA: sugar phosphate isomerase/epimerase family protein, partial [Aequorivita sp.]|nr:sugar phosphate isomerase/epimerase family protein [Aequorivita sp.]